MTTPIPFPTPPQATPRLRYFSLLRHAVQLGQALPDPDSIDLNDPDEVAAVRHLLEEFNAAVTGMNAILREVN